MESSLPDDRVSGSGPMTVAVSLVALSRDRYFQVAGRPHLVALMKPSWEKNERPWKKMRMKEKLGLHSAAELRQKAREWLARSAVNRIREEPEPDYGNGTRLRVAL